MFFPVKALLPPLARWTAAWLQRSGVPIDYSDALSYLLSSTPTDAAPAMARVLEDDHFKLLNLSRQWLRSLLPHTLSRCNRVTFGLLSPADVAHDPHTPQSRRLLAVPFVGRDCPSRYEVYVISHKCIRYRYTV